MKKLALAAALALAAPAFADDAKVSAAPAAPAPEVRAIAAPTFEVPMKEQSLDGLDKLMEKRLAAKPLPKAEIDTGLREVPKKKDEAAGDDAANGAAAQH